MAPLFWLDTNTPLHQIYVFLAALGDTPAPGYGMHQQIADLTSLPLLLLA